MDYDPYSIHLYVVFCKKFSAEHLYFINVALFFCKYKLYILGAGFSNIHRVYGTNIIMLSGQHYAMHADFESGY